MGSEMCIRQSNITACIPQNHAKLLILYVNLAKRLFIAKPESESVIVCQSYLHSFLLGLWIVETTYRVYSVECMYMCSVHVQREMRRL